MTAEQVATVWVGGEEEATRYSEALEEGGFAVERVAGEEELLERAHARLPAVVLVDLDTAGEAGWSGVNRLHASRATCDVPVIALSSQDLLSRATLLRDAGFCGFISRGIGAAALLSAVRYCINRTTAGAEWVDLSGF